MVKKVSFAVICLFWVVMTGLLIKREAVTTTDEVFYKEFVKTGLSDRDVVMDIYWGGKRAGESKTSYVLSESGGTILNEASLFVEGIGDVKISTMAQVSKASTLRHIVVDVEYGGNRVCAVGTTEGSDIKIRITGLGPEKEFRVPSPGAMAFASGPFPILAIRDLRVGAEWDVPLFDFSTMTAVSARARVSDQQEISWGGSSVDCYRIVVANELGREMLVARADNDGRLLEMEFAGIRFVRRADDN